MVVVKVNYTQEIFLEREGLHDLVSHVLPLVLLVSVHGGAEEDEEGDDPEKCDHDVVLRPPLSGVDVIV